MRVLPTELPGVLIVEPKCFGDARGYFMETYQAERYRGVGIPGPFIQDNLSQSPQGVLRGLHLQFPNPQGKLVSVLKGEVFDVVVDIRLGSPTFGRWLGVTLNDDNKRQLWVPPGMAHGFLVISSNALFHYKVTDFYHPESELTLLWNDPEVGISWPTHLIQSGENPGQPRLAAKDQAGLRLADLPRNRLVTYAPH